MTDPVPAEDQETLFPKSVGEKLREAREAHGLSLAEIAARTRVPVRQLEAIEAGKYSLLPSITYSVGFAKAYARAVELNEVEIAREVRAANEQPSAVRRTEYEAYTVDEPSRVPPRGLAIGALIVAVLLLVGAGLYYGTNLFRGDESQPAPAVANVVPEASVPTAAPTPTPTAPAGPVVLTATDEVWLKVYDGAGKTLYLGTLKTGETFAVPTDAVGPMINVGRPDKLQVTVGGTPVAPLGDGKRAIKDVKIDAASLTARAVPDAASVPDATPADTTRATHSSGRTTTRSSARSISATAAPLNMAAPVPVAPEPVAPAPAATPAP